MMRNRDISLGIISVLVGACELHIVVVAMGMSLALALILSTTPWKKRKKRSSKAKGRRQRGDDLVMPEIPLDLQFYILTRLPIKSQVRFKCVSKLWSSLIHSRCFSNGYLRVASTPRLYVSSVEHLNCGLMNVCQNPEKSVLLSLSLSSSKSAFDLDLTMQGLGGHNMVVLRGLILYTVCRQACIYNPTTGQRVTLPALESNFFAEEGNQRHVLYYLGHDPVLDQYKVVCIEVICSGDFEPTDAHYWVFVMEAGGSWKRIEFDQPHLPTRLGLCINGVIYYLANSLMSTENVFSFDVRSEEFNMIQAPEIAESVGFINYGGKPTLFDYTHLKNMGLVDLWVLEDATNWSRKSLVLQPCQMHLVNNDIDLWVEGTTQNGEVILLPLMMIPDYILYYDLHKNDLRKVEIRGLSDHVLSNPSYLHFALMDSGESIMRLQT